MNLHCHPEMCEFVGVAFQGSSKEDGLGLRYGYDVGVPTSFNLSARLVVVLLHECAKTVVDSALEGFNPLLAEKTVVGGVIKMLDTRLPIIL